VTRYGLSLSHGGHLSHGVQVNFSGMIYRTIFMELIKTGLIDYDKVRKLAKGINLRCFLQAQAHIRDN
jgi:glycine hydroxymethyltransferase